MFDQSLNNCNCLQLNVFVSDDVDGRGLGGDQQIWSLKCHFCSGQEIVYKLYNSVKFEVTEF